MGPARRGLRGLEGCASGPKTLAVRLGRKVVRSPSVGCVRRGGSCGRVGGAGKRPETAGRLCPPLAQPASGSPETLSHPNWGTLDARPSGDAWPSPAATRRVAVDTPPPGRPELGKAGATRAARQAWARPGAYGPQRRLVTCRRAPPRAGRQPISGRQRSRGPLLRTRRLARGRCR